MNQTSNGQQCTTFDQVIERQPKECIDKGDMPTTNRLNNIQLMTSLSTPNIIDPTWIGMAYTFYSRAFLLMKVQYHATDVLEFFFETNLNKQRGRFKA